MTGEPGEGWIKNGLWEAIPMTRFVAERVPELVIDPKVTGWYRIYAGVYGDALDYWSAPRLLARFERRAVPSIFAGAARHEGAHGAGVLEGGGSHRQKDPHFQPQGPMPHPGLGFMGGMTQLRLVPMTEQEVADSKKERTLPPVNQRLFAMLDTTDEIFWNGTAESEDDIRAMIYRHRQAGFGRIYWRCFGTFLDNSLSVPAARALVREGRRGVEEETKRSGGVAQVHRPLAPLRSAEGRRRLWPQGRVRSACHGALHEFQPPALCELLARASRVLAQMLATKKDP